jgi:two-component system nitrate/nitrite response regulator NarL
MTQTLMPPETRPDYPVLVVDDHEMFADVLSMALDAHRFDARRLVPASADDIVRQAESLPPGLVVLDLDLGDSFRGEPMCGADLVRPLRTLGWSVLVVTDTPTDPEVARAVAEGADGVLPKTARFSALLNCVLRLASGEVTMSGLERRTWLARNREQRRREEERSRLLEQLTEREREVLELLARGRRPAAIADQFMLSVGTVRVHIKSIRAKLGVRSQLEAAALVRSGSET